MKKLAAVILAAGQGTRMKSGLAKVLHPLLGKPLIKYSIETARSLKAEMTVVVIGVQAERVKKELEKDEVLFALQRERLGTGHAVMAAMPALKGFKGDVAVFYGDCPLLRPETIKDLISAHRRKRAAMSLLTAVLDDCGGYGRIVRDEKGEVRAIVEHKDCTADQRLIHEMNPGVYVFEDGFLRKSLRGLTNNNKQGEYYLTDLLAMAVESGQKVASSTVKDAEEIMGVNDRMDLAAAAGVMRLRVIADLAKKGVTFECPETTHVEPGVTIGPDTVIEPGARLSGRTVIGPNCVIQMNSRIEDCVIGRGVTVKSGSALEQSKVGDGVQIGPMAHLRPGSVIGPDARIGNFVETKKAVIGKGSKLSHLTYCGDAEVGSEVNVGCGFITCNYDGVNKHKTIIGDGVFIGSDTQAVAPVKIGDGAYIGSGSTVTRDVPADSLVMTRPPTTVKEGWAAKKRAARKKKKGNKKR